MNHPADGPREQLLKLVNQHQQQQCQQIIQEAESQARIFIDTAKQTSKRRIQTAIKTEESRMETALMDIRAQHATEHRHAHLTQTRALLDRGWTLLTLKLQERWQLQNSREQWLVFLIHQTVRLFPNGGWKIIHPPEWDTSEWMTQQKQLVPLIKETPLFEINNDLKTGLKIGCQGAWLDGSLQGIMNNHHELSALLLARLETSLSKPDEECL